MICSKAHHAGGENCMTCIEHAVFKAAAERRKANSIRNRKFSIMCDEAAVVSLSEYWEGWIDTLGKQKAVDFLILCMREYDEKLRAALERRKERARPQPRG
jgi:hypothetical protein